MSTPGLLVKKFHNDWSINLAGMMAYSLVTSLFPLLLAIFSLAGMILNAADPRSLLRLAKTIDDALPPQVQALVDVPHLMANLVQLTGPLAVIALIGLLWTGSNLFTNMENAFSIVFRTGNRDFIHQKRMACGMVVLLALLLPVSSVMTAASQAFQAVLPAPLVSILTIIGPVVSLAILWLLFLAIYRIVPNTSVPFQHAWPGATVAAILFAVLQLVFPLYFKLFLSGNAKFGAAALSVLVLVIWLWLFAVIIMVGAQVTAVAMGFKPTSDALPRLLRQSYVAQTAPPIVDAGQGQHSARHGAEALHLGVATPLKILGHLVAMLARALALLAFLAVRPFVPADDRAPQRLRSARAEPRRYQYPPTR